MRNTNIPDVICHFRDDDPGFITWCLDNPTGFVLNRAGFVLHAATRGGNLCPYFRNGNLASGFEPNLTSGARVKICWSNRAALEAYAQQERPGNNIRECASCLGPGSPLAATSDPHSDEMPANRPVLSAREAQKKPRQSDIRTSARIFRRDGWICHWCGRPVICAAAMKCLARFVRETGMAAPIAYYDLHWTRSNAPLLDHMGAVVDHIEPHSSGGQYEDTNLVTSCCKCNALKSAAKQKIFRVSHPRRLIKGRYGEPQHWDGLSTLLMLLVEQKPDAATSLEQRWWHALKSDER